MAKETGVVTKLKGGNAMVKTQRSGACEGCSEKSTCHALGSGKEMEIEALNPVNAGVGDTVTLEIATGHMLRLSFVLYIFPIISLLFGAIVGDQTASAVGMDESVLSAILGFVGFFLALMVILGLEKKARHSDKYKPTIIGIKRAERRGLEKCEVCH